MFYSDSEHPDTLQRVDLHLGAQRQEAKTLENFLEAKVFRLGFKSGNARSLESNAHRSSRCPGFQDQLPAIQQYLPHGGEYGS